MPAVLNARGRGWTADTLPPNSVYVGRWTWPIRISSKWRNRYHPDTDGMLEEVIAKYCGWLLRQSDLIVALPELRGCDLICWCAPAPCHADVLLEIANA